MRTSTIYTIGTALTRAQGTGVSVDVLVTGQWLHGHVSAVDGHGLVLHGDDDVLSVLRMDSISAVQVRQAAAFEAHGQVEAPREEATVHPMPAAGGDSSWGQHARQTSDAPSPTHDAPSTYGAGPVTYATSPTYEAGPVTYDAGPIVVPAPRPRSGSTRSVQRPTVGPIIAPSAVPDAGLHTMLRSRRQPSAAE
jgi:hypothetical protein